MYSLFVWAVIALAPFSAIAEAGLCSDNGDFQCGNGACIPVDAKCDGNPDCPDASDETHALCYNHYCHPSRFRCAYGGCVDGSAPCGQSPQCFDNSDLRLLSCRNKTAVVDGEFNCENGEKIPVDQLCDGEKHCADGTDESVRACAGRRCAKGQFQCKYGACVAGRAKCDESSNNDCADGSDEDGVLCDRRTTVVFDDESSLPIVNDFGYPECWTGVTSPDHGQLLLTKGPQGAIPEPKVLTATYIVECTPPYRLDVPEEMHCERGQWSAPVPQCNLPPPESKLCVLPSYPHMGTYAVVGMPEWPEASQQIAFDSVLLNVTCSPSYTRIGPELVDCYHGKWSVDPFPYCLYYCEVPHDPSVTYYCGDDFDQQCGDYVKSGDTALPKCNEHYTRDFGAGLQTVKCSDNGWEFLQSCDPEPEDITLVGLMPSIEETTPAATKCVVPEHPQYGKYSVAGRPDARPGMTFDSMTINIVECDAWMRPDGPAEMTCSNGQWSVDKLTTCWYFCEIPRHHSVTYYCGNSYNEKCDDFVISDTSVRPKCNEYYTTRGMLLDMHCIYGNWNFVETCDLDVKVSHNENNVTIRLGKNLVLRLSGAQYSAAVDLNSERITDWTIPEPPRRHYLDNDYY